MFLFFCEPWHCICEDLVMPTQCPQCGKDNMSRLHRRGVLEHLLSFCFIYPYRCQACWQCFKAFKWRTRCIKPQARRQHERFETSFTVVFSWGHTDGEGIVTNIGLGGCRVNTAVELTEDCCWKLKLQVPGSKPEIRVEKAVVRTVEKGSFGLSFSRVLGDEKKRLGQFLVQLMQEKEAA